MTTGTLKSQGTALFLVDALSSSEAVVLKFECPTGITGIGEGAADQLEDTCLSEKKAKTYKGGLENPGQMSVPFNFIPSGVSHQILWDLKASRDVVEWMVCLSEGDEVPTLDSEDRLVPPPAPSRTSIAFDAFVANLSIDINTNAIVTGTLTLQRSGSDRPYWNAPIPT